MKTIEEAMNIAYKDAKQNAYFGEGFYRGVNFAQSWIDVNDELPSKAEQYLVKTKSVDFVAILDFLPDHKLFISRDTGFAINDVTYWRPINIE